MLNSKLIKALKKEGLNGFCPLTGLPASIFTLSQTSFKPTAMADEKHTLTYITLLIKISVLCGPVPWALAFCPSDREVVAQQLRGRSRTPRRKERGGTGL